MLRLAALLAIVLPATSLAQQVADPHFDATVAHPAHTTRHPRVVIDEAHHNFHTSTGRYRPFAQLVTNDGCVVTAGSARFTPAALAGVDVLVIANAAGSDDRLSAGTAAFDSSEVATLVAWVRQGGALLLIADHAPYGDAARALAAGFGVQMGGGFVADSVQFDTRGENRSVLVFSTENGLLGRHAITRGRDSSESVRNVLTFTGQSLVGPAGSVALLQLGAGAYEVPAPSQADIAEAVRRARAENGGAGGARRLQLPRGAATSVAGRAQGLALRLGRGRVVVLGEAAQLSAQLTTNPIDGTTTPMGLNVAGTDNRQFALNVVRWLTGVLPD